LDSCYVTNRFCTRAPPPVFVGPFDRWLCDHVLFLLAIGGIV
jgi:hypothetical protein